MFHYIFGKFWIFKHQQRLLVYVKKSVLALWLFTQLNKCRIRHVKNNQKASPYHQLKHDPFPHVYVPRMHAEATLLQRLFWERKREQFLSYVLLCAVTALNQRQTFQVNIRNNGVQKQSAWTVWKSCSWPNNHTYSYIYQ